MANFGTLGSASAITMADVGTGYQTKPQTGGDKALTASPSTVPGTTMSLVAGDHLLYATFGWGASSGANSLVGEIYVNGALRVNAVCMALASPTSSSASYVWSGGATTALLRVYRLSGSGGICYASITRLIAVQLG